jgi:hypothetical protein
MGYLIAFAAGYFAPIVLNYYGVEPLKWIKDKITS